MKYSKEFISEPLDLEGEILIEFDVSNSVGPAVLEGTLLIDNHEKDEELIKFNGKHGVSVSPTIFDSSNNQINDVLIFLPPDTSEIVFTLESLNVEEDVVRGSEIKFADRSLLTLGNEIRRVDTFDKHIFRRRVQIYKNNDNNIWPIINFVCDLAALTDFEEFLKILTLTIDSYPAVKRVQNDIVVTIFKRLILGKAGGKRHQIQDMSDFESKSNDLSNVNDSVSLDIERSLKYALEECDERGDSERILQILNNFRLIDSYPEVLSDKYFFLLLAEEILRHSEPEVRNLLDQYFESQSNRDFKEEVYNEKKRDAQDASFPDDQEKWYELVSYSRSEPGSRELKYIVAHLLATTASNKSDQPDFYHIAPRMFLAAGQWFDDINHGSSQRCLHEYNLRKGLYLFHKSMYAESSEHFSEALRIAANDSGEYNQIEPGWFTYPIIYQSLADSRDLTYSGDLKQATELLKDRMDAIAKLETIDETDRNRIVSALGGERFRILSDLLLQNEEYERANEVLGKAIGLFTDGGLNRSADDTLRKKEQVTAILKEVTGNLSDAANRHQSLSENSEYSDGERKVHRIRSDLCEAKISLLNDDIDGTLEKVQAVHQRTEKLQGDALQIGVLVHVLKDYKGGNITDAKRAIQKLPKENQHPQSSNPLRVEWDYTEPIVVLLSLQRLRQTRVPNDLLDSMISISINQAITPQKREDAIDDLYLEDITIERLWRERLPSIVLSRIEDIQLQSATAVGNHKSVTLLLAEALEIHLTILAEFHGKRCWGKNWLNELSEEEDVDKPNVGTLSKIFTSEVKEFIDNSQELREIYFNDVDEFSNITEMRNKFDHAYEGYIEPSRFDNLREWIFDFLRNSVSDIPLIIEIEHKNDIDLYTAQIHWWKGQRRILLDSERELEIDSYYYIKSNIVADSNNQILFNIESDEIEPVDDERVIRQLND